MPKKNMNLNEIHLSIGIGDLKFGMTKSNVISVLGNEYYEDIDENGDVELEYEQLAIRFTFWKEFDYRLGVISTERSTATLYGECLFGKSIEDLREFIRDKLGSDSAEEDGCIHEDGHRQEWIEVDEKNVTFWFWNNELYLIDCFCAWSDNDTPIWPYGGA